MKIRLSGYVRRNGARHKPGSFLELPDREGERLIALGVADEVAAPKPKPPLSADDPESFAAASVRELAEFLPTVENPTVLELALEIERAKEQPRSTVIEAVEKRLAEIAAAAQNSAGA